MIRLPKRLTFINYATPYDPSPDKLYRNMALSSWAPLAAGALAAYHYDDFRSVNDDGTPKGDFDWVIANNAELDFGGTYLIRFIGQATVAPGQYPQWYTFMEVPGRPSRYDAATNTTEFLVKLAPGSFNFALSFTQTKCLAGDNAVGGTGIGFCWIIRPDAPNSDNWQPVEGSLFYGKFLDRIRTSNGVRHMDGLGTNQYPDSKDWDWSMRTLPTDQRQVDKTESKIGMAFEHTVALSNETDTHYWGNIPFRATDNLIVKMLTAIKNGTDGVNPVADGTANPAYAGLKPTLKVFLEFGNENWNTDFKAHDYFASKGSVVANGSGINFDGACTGNNDVSWRRYYISRFVNFSKLVRQVFGDAAMGTRVFCMLGVQQNYTQQTVDLLQFLSAYYGSAAHVSDPRPPSYYAQFIAMGGYRWLNDVDNTKTVAHAYDSGMQSIDTAAQATIAAGYGMGTAIYEMAFAPPSYYDKDNPFIRSVLADPQAGPMVTKLMMDAFADGAQIGCYFATTAQPWDLLPVIDGPDTIKWLAWLPFQDRVGVVPTVTSSATVFTDADQVSAGLIANSAVFMSQRRNFPTAGFLTATFFGYQTGTAPAIELRIDGVGVTSGAMPDVTATGIVQNGYMILRAEITAGDHYISFVQVGAYGLAYNTTFSLKFTLKGEQRTIVLDDDFSTLADGAKLETGGQWALVNPNSRSLVRDAAAGGVRVSTVASPSPNSAVVYSLVPQSGTDHRVEIQVKTGGDTTLFGVTDSSVPAQANGPGMRMYFYYAFMGKPDGNGAPNYSQYTYYYIIGNVISFGYEIVGNSIRYLLNGAYATIDTFNPAAGSVPTIYIQPDNLSNQTVFKRLTVTRIDQVDPAPPPVVVIPVSAAISGRTTRQFEYVVGDASASREVARAIADGANSPLSFSTMKVLRANFGPPSKVESYDSNILPVAIRKKIVIFFGDVKAGNEFADQIEIIGAADPTNATYIALRNFVG